VQLGRRHQHQHAWADDAPDSLSQPQDRLLWVLGREGPERATQACRRQGATTRVPTAMKKARVLRAFLHGAADGSGRGYRAADFDPAVF
jgi:hypothetical protein